MESHWDENFIRQKAQHIFIWLFASHRSYVYFRLLSYYLYFAQFLWSIRNTSCCCFVRLHWLCQLTSVPRAIDMERTMNEVYYQIAAYMPINDIHLLNRIGMVFHAFLVVRNLCWRLCSKIFVKSNSFFYGISLKIAFNGPLNKYFSLLISKTYSHIHRHMLFNLALLSSLNWLRVYKYKRRFASN